MSDIIETQAKRPRLLHHLTISLLSVLLSLAPTTSRGEGVSDYGARMCAEAGIPADECTLTTDTGSTEAATAPGKGSKAATLVDHGRWVCAKEGVPEEDCVALPNTHRTASDIIPATSPFLTVPEQLPVVDVVTAPVATAPFAPIPARRPSVRVVRLAPPVEPGFRVIGPPVLPTEPGFRAVGPPVLPVEPGFRVVGPPILPADPGFRDVRQSLAPVDLGFGSVRQPAAPVDVEFFDVLPLPPEEPGTTEVFVFEEDRRERFLAFEPRGRCQRAVRYSGPASQRFITC